MKSYIADTNIFLRFILRDIPEQYTEAEKFFGEAKKKRITIIVPQIVIFEIHFALLKFYRFPKSDVVDRLESILSAKYFQIEAKEWFSAALAVYKTRSLDFVDCFLLSQAQESGAELFTFDKSLHKFSKSL